MYSVVISSQVCSCAVVRLLHIVAKYAKHAKMVKFHIFSFLDSCLMLISTLTASNGALGESCLTMKSYNLKSFQFTIDNEKWPKLDMDSDFTSHSDFTRPYSELFSNCQSFEDVGSFISPKRFRDQGYTYFRVNFSNMPEFTRQAIEPRKTSQVRLECNFSTATTHALRYKKCVLYVKYINI